MLHAGIDLHGTLITDHPEEVPVAALGGLLEAMRGSRGQVKLYACTGNDLGFLRRKLPGEVMELLDGAVLETGCVVSDMESETVLVDADTVGAVKRLEAELRKLELPWVYKFARRLSSISMFTRMGLVARDYRDEVAEAVRRLGYEEAMGVTYSSVAVDVIPRGFNKLRGLRRLAGGEEAAGIADSMNDYELLSGADYAFLPGNCSRELLERLESGGKRIRLIEEASGLERGVVIQCRSRYTDAVSEALRFMSRAL